MRMVHACAWWVILCGMLSGCCVPMREAEELDRALVQENRQRATQEMQRAAAQLGATLLEGWAGSIRTPRYCDPEPVLRDATVPLPPRLHSDDVAPPPGFLCIEDTSHDLRVLQMLEKNKLRRTWIALRDQDRGAARYARLARRGDELFVLVPKLTRHIIDHRTQCECDGMPRIVSREVTVFSVPAMAVDRVHDVVVPVTEEAIDWECESALL